MANYFSLILTVVTIVSGLLWLYDAKFLKPKRQAVIAEVEKKTTSPLTEEQVEQLAPQPKLMELGQSIFPVIALVLVELASESSLELDLFKLLVTYLSSSSDVSE